ncbi:MAG: hypothetical protein PF551_02895 [Candidatus Marinimicrobia bacterium]|jgi:hypothetical protein|nr:hypothetical protein [Candidatus Neomarinimicrobiota bacterium]
MKKLLTIILMLSLMILSGCFLDSDDDSDNNSVTESFLTGNIWYFNDCNTQIELTTNSNQTTYNLFEEGIGGITISGDALSKGMGSITLSYFHYAYHSPTYSSVALDNLTIGYPSYFFSYSYNSYESTVTKSMSFDFSINDSTYTYYQKSNDDYLNNNVDWDTTNFKLTVSNDISLINYYDSNDSVIVSSGSIEAKQISIPANTPTTLNTPVINIWTKREFSGMELDFNVNGNVYVTEINYLGETSIDTSKWTLDGSQLTIIDGEGTNADTVIMSASSNNDKLEIGTVEIVDAEELQYEERDFNLDNSSLTKSSIIQTLTFAKTALTTNISPSREHFIKTENGIKKILQKAPIHKFGITSKLLK